MTRFFDIILSLLGLLFLLPLFIIIITLIKLSSKGPAFYQQTRIGKNAQPFELIKFRSMRIGSDQKGLLTIGKRDPRITQIGAFLRKYKLDELPQLVNVLKGEMSLVGPRPEVPYYVELYTEEERKVLSVRPGITDYASIAYINENEQLSQAENPEEYYRNIILHEKLRLNLQYISQGSVKDYFLIIFLTIKKIILH